MTSRRFFLAALAGATLDPERLLWQPGRKLISIPAAVVVIPPCPFYVSPHFGLGGDERVAAAMNELVRRHWRGDGFFRERVMKAIRRGDMWLAHEIGRLETEDIRAERGYYATMLTVMNRRRCGALEGAAREQALTVVQS